jgi:hypothetical protein
MRPRKANEQHERKDNAHPQEAHGHSSIRDQSCEAETLMEKNDLEALKFLKEWSSWLAAIETGAIAIIGTMTKDIKPPDHIPLLAQVFASTATLGFLISLLGAGYLLLGLPGIAQRLPPAAHKDIFSMKAGGGKGMTLVFWVRWELIAAGVGMLFFVLLVLFFIWR